MSSQLDYQNANDALYRWEIENGSNAELTAFARETLPKIDDHMHRVEALGVASSSHARRERPIALTRRPMGPADEAGTAIRVAAFPHKAGAAPGPNRRDARRH